MDIADCTRLSLIGMALFLLFLALIIPPGGS